MSRRRFLVLAPSLAVAASMLRFEGVEASSSGWYAPLRVYNTPDFISRPLLLADREGDVHLLFVNNGADPEGPPTATLVAPAPPSIKYARLHGGRWSMPEDVLASPGSGGMDATAAAIDVARGYLHVVWRGPGNQTLYSKAHVSDAASALGWSTPTRLSVGPSLGSSLATAPDGTVHFVYGDVDGTIYHRRSLASVGSWTSPISVAISQRTSAVAGTEGMVPDALGLIVDAHGRLHLTWTEFQLPRGWPPMQSFYSQSTDGGTTWSDPRRIAPGNYGYVAIASTDPDTIHLVWNSIVQLGERRHSYSTDGGHSWTQSTNISESFRGGFTGFPALVVDSLGTLHLITSVNGQDRATEPYRRTEDVLHLTWIGRRWSEPTWLSKGAVGRRSVEQPTAAIGLGNHLHVAYEDDFHRIWYTGRPLQAPTLPPISAPPPQVPPIDMRSGLQATPLPRATTVPRPEPSPTPIAPVVPRGSLGDVTTTTTTGVPIGPAAVASLLAVIPALIYRRMRHRP